jgi:hypothetical protein
VAFTPSLLTGKGWVVLNVGQRKAYRVAKMHKSEFARVQEAQKAFPSFVCQVGHRGYWQFQDRFYYTDDQLDANAVHALLVTREQRKQQQIDRAQQIMALGQESRTSPKRRMIPDDVKHLVWTRDGGRCRYCASDVELQFDHIIPVAMGGSDAPENLQVLCGPCNRRKSASITLR